MPKINVELCKYVIDRSGYTQVYIASKMGITVQRMSGLVNGKLEWTVYEADQFKKLLKLTNQEFKEIFLLVKSSEA